MSQTNKSNLEDRKEAALRAILPEDHHIAEDHAMAELEGSGVSGVLCSRYVECLEMLANDGPTYGVRLVKMNARQIASYEREFGSAIGKDGAKPKRVGAKPMSKGLIERKAGSMNYPDENAAILREMTVDDFQKAYLDYVNNFISRERFASYYGLTERQAKTIIERGCAIHELYAAAMKSLKEG